jgi:hypothetical protein
MSSAKKKQKVEDDNKIRDYPPSWSTDRYVLDAIIALLAEQPIDGRKRFVSTAKTLLEYGVIISSGNLKRFAKNVHVHSDGLRVTCLAGGQRRECPTSDFGRRMYRNGAPCGLNKGGWQPSRRTRARDFNQCSIQTRCHSSRRTPLSYADAFLSTPHEYVDLVVVH